MRGRMARNKQYIIRDIRTKEKFLVDDAYLNGYARLLGPYVSAVYLSLCRHANKEQECWPGQTKIAEEWDISERMVRKCIKALKEANVIQVIKERTEKGQWLNNVYILLDKSQWAHPEVLPCRWHPEAQYGTTQRHSEAKTRGTPVPIKETHNKETHMKETHNKDIAEQSSAFVWDDYLKAMLADKQRHIRIIGLYWREKKFSFENRQQVRAALKRELKAAKELEGYNDRQLVLCMRWLADYAERKGFIWKLETVAKMIGEYLAMTKMPTSDAEVRAWVQS